MNKKAHPVLRETRVRLTREQYDWLAEQADIECEGNKAQMVRKLITEKMKGRDK